MACSCSTFGCAADQQFTRKKAVQELSKFREKGPGPTTRLLLQGLATSGALKGVLLDIGSGIGSLSFELLERGMSAAIAVDASSAYLAAAAEEAERRQRADAVRFVVGDFVTLAPDLPRADVVTLDRVVCCYPSFTALLAQAIAHADRCVALSYPRRRWHVRTAVMLENGVRRLTGNPFRTFIHPAAEMRQLIRSGGFELVSRAHTLSWCVDVYVRRLPSPTVARDLD